jgi:hypothetical protein
VTASPAQGSPAQGSPATEPDEPDPGRCGTCGRGEPVAQVTWCPAWEAYLCADCRQRRAEAELGLTERANAAALIRQPGNPGARQASAVRGASPGLAIYDEAWARE